MNEQFTRQAQEMFNVFNGAAKDARIPESFQAFAEEGVAKTREAYQKMNSAAKDGAKVFEEIVVTGQQGARTIGEKMLSNTMANTEKAFAAAEAIARARTLPEAARLQADFVQQQMALAGAQTRELFELSSKIARQTFETFNAATTKTFDQIKKSS